MNYSDSFKKEVEKFLQTYEHFSCKKKRDDTANLKVSITISLAIMSLLESEISNIKKDIYNKSVLLEALNSSVKSKIEQIKKERENIKTLQKKIEDIATN